MLSKVIIGLLSSLLVAVVALFLVSEYKEQPELAGTNGQLKEPSSQYLKPDDQPKSPNAELTDTENTSQIPDKSLPIPAHQLKKLLATEASSKEPLSSDSLSDNEELNERINKLNTDLSKLDRKIGSGASTSPQPTTAAPNNDLADRVQHIREHLESINQ